MLRTNPSIAVDGYFEEIPESSVVLLRRVKNGYPVAFYYQYGAGYVFVTSMYEDWGSANYQSTSEGRAFVRDLITWAKKPQALPTYNLSENPNPNISLNLEIKNTSDKRAEKVKISWLDPDRNLVVEEEYSISLNPGEILTFPISRSISHQYRFGIWHVDYTLYDSDGNEIQPQTETDSGRFVIKQSLSGNFNPEKYQIWVTTPTEDVFEGDEIVFTFHFKNNTSEDWNGSIDVYGFERDDWRWFGIGRIENFTVPAGTEKTYDYPIVPANYEIDTTTLRVSFKVDGVGTAHRRVSVINPKCSGNLYSQDYYLKFEEERFSLELQNLVPHSWGGKAKLKIIEYISPIYELEKEFSLSSNGNTKIDFSYIPPSNQSVGKYTAEVEIFFKDRMVNVFRKNFIVSTSQIGLSPNIPKIFKNGETNIISIKLRNSGVFNVNSGNLILKLVSPKGENLFEEAKTLSLAVGEEKDLEFSVPFNLKTSGEYQIRFIYSDETGSKYEISKDFLCKYGYYPVVVSLNKKIYFLGENAELKFSILGGNVEENLEVEVSAPSIGFSEKRNFHFDPTIPVNPLEPSFQFLIPIPFVNSTSIPYYIKIRALSGFEYEWYGNIFISSILVSFESKITNSALNAGSKLEIRYLFYGIDGFVIPMPAQLRIKIPSFGNQYLYPITVNPGETTSFPFEFQIPDNASSGTYLVLSTLELPNGKKIERADNFIIPPPSFSFSVDKETLNAGDEIRVKIENRGGVKADTSYKIEIKDRRGVLILSKNGSSEIDPGSFTEETLKIPEKAVSGVYSLNLLAEDRKTKVSGNSLKFLNISGISSDLTVQTEKESYFKFEDIKGLAQSSNPLEDSRIKLEVVKKILSEGGAETIGISDFLNVNSIHSITSDNSGTLYFATEGGVFSFDGNSFKKIREEKSSTSPDSFFADSKGRLWLGRYYEGLWVYESGSWRKELSNIIINSITEDPSGNIWFGTGKGVLKYDGTSYSSISGCPFTSVYRIRSDGNGKIWVTGYLGIAVYDGTNWIRYRKENSSIPSDWIITFEIDKDNVIWLLYYDELWKFNGENSEKIETPSGYHGFSDIEIDKNGKVFVKGYDSESRNQVILEYNGTWNVIGIFYFELDEWIDDFYTDINGNLWVCGGRGAREYDGSKWSFIYIPGSKGLIEEPIDVKMDSKGNVWIATPYGLQSFDGKDWRNILDDGNHSLKVYAMNIDFSGKIWLATRIGVISFDGLRWSEIIKYPEDSYYYGYLDVYAFDSTSIAVDRDGHIWLGNSASGWQLFEYDGSGWNSREAPENLSVQISEIETDSKGNIWILYGYVCLIRYNTGEVFWDINAKKIFVDKNDTLWAVGDRVWKFDGEWKRFTEEDGYPEEILTEVVSFSEDISGKKWFGGKGKLWDEENQRFIEKFYILSFDGEKWSWKDITEQMPKILISDGGEERLFIPDFMTITYSGEIWFYGEKYSQTYSIRIGGKGIEEKVFWTEEKPFSQSYEASIGKLPETGIFILKGEIYNSLGQKVAEDSFQFSVFSEGISVSAGISSSYVRLNGTASLSGNVSNGEEIVAENINLKVWKKAGGEEELIHEEIFNIQPKSLHPFSLNLPTNEIGLVSLRAEVWKDGTLITQEEIGYEVCSPQLDVSVFSPEYWGDEEFDILVDVKNSGKVESSVKVKVQSLSFEEDVSLNPNEERKILIPARITQTTDFQIEFSGDYEGSITKRVEYGYSGSLELSLLPIYPKGEIEVPISIRNNGKMDWSKNFVFELLDTQGIQIQRIERTYTLSSQRELSDKLSFILSPGEYTIKYHSEIFSGEGKIRVSDPGIGVLSIEDNQRYPEGKVSVPFTLENKDSFPGDFEIEFTLKRGNEEIGHYTKRYLIQPNEKVEDRLFFELSEGLYNLEIRGGKLPPSNVSINVLPYERIAWRIAQDDVNGGFLPISVNLDNSGFSKFIGSILISSSFFQAEENAEVESLESKNFTFSIPLDSAEIGENSFKISLLNSTGEEILKEERKVFVLGSDIRISEIPSGLSFNAGENAEIPFKFKNFGNKEGKATFSFRTMDFDERFESVILKPGEEKELKVQFPIDEDIVDGEYSLFYNFEEKEGEVRYRVQGISIDVSAELDKPSYKEGETAHLTINISKIKEGGLEGFVKVNYLEYEEEKEFTLSSSVSIEFDIPLQKITPEKLFYGVYHKSGRGIHLNSIYIYKDEDVKVSTDKQVYRAGENVVVSITVPENGILKISAPGYEEEFSIEGTTSRTFKLPNDLRAGTYGISWEFRPSSQKPILSGAHLFDVDGILVKVVEAELDKGKYSPGENIQLKVIFESNRDIALTLRTWLLDPEGNYSILGEGTVELKKDEHTIFTSSYPFQTNFSGIHRLIYALYDPSEKLIVSGAESFDCGGAVLLGIRTEKSEYLAGNEPVKVSVDLFGNGSSELRIFLENEEVKKESLNLSGIQSFEIELEPALLKPGYITLRGEILKDNLKSSKETHFSYGSSLPDLTAYLSREILEQLNYRIKGKVVNIGKSQSSSTTISFFEGENILEEREVKALGSDEEIEIEINYDGRGKAGRREIYAEVDRGNSVREFNEKNNRASLTLDIPEVFHELSISKDEFSAFEDCTILSRIFNNTDTELSGEMKISVLNLSSNQIIWEKKDSIKIPPFTESIISSVFNTGTYPEGEYLISQDIEAGIYKVRDEKIIRILRTERIEGNLEVHPKLISPNRDEILDAKVDITNRGNVTIEGELRIEVRRKDNGKKMDEKKIEFSIDINESKEIQREITLNLPEGFYTLSLFFKDEKLDEIEIESRFELQIVKQKSLSARVLVLDNTIPLLDEIKELLKEVNDKEEREMLAADWKFRISKEREFIENVLKSSGVIYRIEKDTRAQINELRKGIWNIFILIGSKPHSPIIEREIREHVFKGDGLIVTLHHLFEETFLREVIGVKVEGLSNWIQKESVTVQTFATPISSEEEWKISSRFVRIKPESEKLLIAGVIKNTQRPVITLNHYGEGKALTFAFPLSISEGEESFEPLKRIILSSIYYLRPQKELDSPISRLVPVELNLSNPTSKEIEIKVEENIPPDSKLYLSYPEMEKNEEKIFWKIKLQPGKSQSILYIAELPDQIGSYEFKSKIYILEEGNERKIDEKILSFSVEKKVKERIRELIVEIERLPVQTMKDKARVRKAINHLESILGRNGESWLNLLDIISAIESIKEIESADPSSARSSLIDLMLFYERRVAERKLMGTSLGDELFN
jgi:ligand-binding sensor domain-containing protein